MKKHTTHCCALLLIFLLAAFSCKSPRQSENILDYVDPFIGTGFHGHTFPGATLPYGMVQLSPDTHLDGWDASSGYHYDDTAIYAFSHTHLSGTGIGDMGDIAILPFTGKTDTVPLAFFKKESEQASPGYYSVILDNYNIKAELTSSLRTGFHRYTFPGKESRNIMLNLSHVLQSSWGGRTIANEFEITDKKSVKGVRTSGGWARKHVVAYYIEFSEEFNLAATVLDGKAGRETSFSGKDASISFEFKESDKPLLLKVAISPVDPEGARNNMLSEIPGWDFDLVKAEAEEIWRQALGGIRIETQDSSVKTNFYTALYHTKMAPFVYQDIDGRYRGMNNEVMQASGGSVNYTAFSLWDTFRAFHPLITISDPEMAAVWSEALVQKYLEGGILPKWPLASNYTGTMVGYPAVAVLADAIAKDLAPAGLDKWLEAALASSTWQPDIYSVLDRDMASAIMTDHIRFKENLGWCPADSLIKSVSYGVEMAYYDWCVAKIAEAAGDSLRALEFYKKSEAYRYYFDPGTGLMRGKNYDGSMVSPFNPWYADHVEGDYVEGNAWQWSFFTPHAMDKIAELYGSIDMYETLLDTLFTTDSRLDGEGASGDITGLIGQYAHGNEPSHHMAYLYNWTNAPYKTQEILDRILKEFYLPEPAGIIGNEDCGQMSAWYVLSALGFYQLCPGEAVYTIGRPMIDRAFIRSGNGNFEILVHNNSPGNKYVKELRLNGEILENPFFKHSDIREGGKLEFFMTDSPV